MKNSVIEQREEYQEEENGCLAVSCENTWREKND